MEETFITGHGLLWFGLRLLAIVAGVLIVYLGYRLLKFGIFQPVEHMDIEAIWGDRKLLLRRASPGALFALAGLAVIISSVVTAPKGTTRRSRTTTTTMPASATENREETEVIEVEVEMGEEMGEEMVDPDEGEM